MSAPREPFTRTSRWRIGYHRGEVDELFERLDTRLVAAAAGLGTAPSAEEIRRVGFTLVRGGYDVAVVDAALDVLEARAIELDLQSGEPVEPPDMSLVLRPVLERSAGERFTRTGVLRRGYDADEVDDFCHRLAQVWHGVPGATSVSLGADEVRSATFAGRRHGYDEDEVDAFLDAVVDVLLRTAPLTDRPG